MTFQYRDPSCGGVAFLYDALSRPTIGDLIRAEQARLLTGEQPQVGTVMRCGTCQQILREPLMSEQLEVCA